MSIHELFAETIFLTRHVSSTEQNISFFFAVLCIEETSITFTSTLYIILVHKLAVFPPFYSMSHFTAVRSIYRDKKRKTGCRKRKTRIPDVFVPEKKITRRIEKVLATILSKYFYITKQFDGYNFISLQICIAAIFKYFN